ncbi:hypothetical protein AAMO2058_000829700 [Amorphochlora amoebiformis]
MMIVCLVALGAVGVNSRRTRGLRIKGARTYRSQKEPSSSPWRIQRLRGGGGDGGSTQGEHRASYMKLFEIFNKELDENANPETYEKNLLDQQYRAKNCMLTSEPLNDGPISCDDLGNMYRTIPLLWALYKDTCPKKISVHTFRPAHLTHLKLTKYSPKEEPKERIVMADDSDVGEVHGVNNPYFCCPITGLVMDGRNPFVALKPWGHVISREAVINNPTLVSSLVQTRNWTGDNVIPLNPTGVQIKKQDRSIRENIRLKRGADQMGALSEDKQTSEDLEEQAKVTHKQKRMREYVIGKAEEHRTGALDSEGDNTDADNFLDRAAHFTNQDRSLAGGIQADGRAGAEVIGFNRRFSEDKRRIITGDNRLC